MASSLHIGYHKSNQPLTRGDPVPRGLPPSFTVHPAPPPPPSTRQPPPCRPELLSFQEKKSSFSWPVCLQMRFPITARIASCSSDDTLGRRDNWTSILQTGVKDVTGPSELGSDRSFDSRCQSTQPGCAKPTPSATSVYNDGDPKTLRSFRESICWDVITNKNRHWLSRREIGKSAALMAFQLKWIRWHFFRKSLTVKII